MKARRTRERLKLYPRTWKDIVRRVRHRAGDRCECTGQCGLRHVGDRCGAPNAALIQRLQHDKAQWRSYVRPVFGTEPEWGGAVRVMLTTAHLCHDPSCSDESHLLSACQLCHLRIDRFEHAQHAAETRERNRLATLARGGQRELFTDGA